MSTEQLKAIWEYLMDDPDEMQCLFIRDHMTACKWADAFNALARAIGRGERFDAIPYATYSSIQVRK